MNRFITPFLVLINLLAATIANGQTSKPAGPVARDLKEFRAAHPMHLQMHGPPPQAWQDQTPLKVPTGVKEVTYESDDLELKAWLSDIPADGKLHPAVVFCHGGFWFGNEDWDVLKPFLDAGYVVMAPRVRAENGNPGDFEYYYGEVDDVIAAGKFLADQTGIDKDHVFVSGHSAGADLATLAVMLPNPFAMAAPISPALDMRLLVKLKDQRHLDLIVFDPNNADEVESRCAMLFTASLRRPIAIFHGDKDWGMKLPDQFAGLAHHFKKDATVTTVPGSHGEPLPNSIPKVIQLFQGFKSQDAR